MFSNLFDLHTSLSRCHNGGTLAVSIENESKINLPDNINSLMNENSIDLQSLFGCLMSH